MRPVVAKGLVPRQTPAGVNRKLANKLHYHSCAGCTLIYKCSCPAADVNGRCWACRGGRRPSWDVARDPQDCCINNCRQMTLAEDLARYQLAGPGPWFQCKTCARCHGAYPQKKETA